MLPQHHCTVMVNRSGFSLIELLVVVLIISVLSAMLMPALQIVRETTRQIVCGSNLRQLGVAMHAYTDDWEGRIPPNNVTSGTGSDIRWSMVLADYIESEISLVFVQGTRPRGPFACPSSRNLVNWGNGDYAKSKATGMQPWETKTLGQLNATMLVIADSNVRDLTPGNHGHIAWRHRNRANALHLDTHIAAYGSSELPTDGDLYPWK